MEAAQKCSQGGLWQSLGVGPCAGAESHAGVHGTSPSALSQFSEVSSLGPFS